MVAMGESGGSARAMVCAGGGGAQAVFRGRNEAIFPLPQTPNQGGPSVSVATVLGGDGPTVIPGGWRKWSRYTTSDIGMPGFSPAEVAEVHLHRAVAGLGLVWQRGRWRRSIVLTVSCRNDYKSTE